MAELPDPYANLKDAVRREERERCAQVAETFWIDDYEFTKAEIAAAIRRDVND